MTRQVFLFGRNGRMGQAIEAQIEASDDLAVAGGVSAGEALIVPSSVDVVIDFSGAKAAFDALRFAKEHGFAIVAGTTGMGQDYLDALKEASTHIPVLYAANMSLGVNVLRYLVERAAATLPEDWDIEIVELHHKRKVDSPSGTAIALLESANAGLGREAQAGLLASREGIVGARTEDEIGVFGVRGGTVAGEHTVFFFGENERIELTHRATDRDIFARGAVRAARWLIGKPAGLYSINDVLGLK